MHAMGKSKENRKSTFAINMVARRIAMGFQNAQDFAAHADMPYPTVRDIEAGISNGSRKTRAKIAASLKCTVDELNTPVEASMNSTTGPMLMGQLSVAEFRAAIEALSASYEEVARLRNQVSEMRKTIRALKEILDKLPEALLSLWPGTPRSIQDAVLYMMGEERPLTESLPKEFGGRVASALEFVGVVNSRTPKGRAAR